MGAITKYLGIITAVVAVTAIPVSAGENIVLSIVPVGGTTVAGNQLVTVEVFITNNGPDQPLRGTQVNLPCSLPNGTAGMITTGTADSDSMSTVSVNTGGSSGGIPFMFPGGLGPTNQNFCTAAGTICVGCTEPEPLPAGATRYLATYRYRVSTCAAGTFDVYFECDNLMPMATRCTGAPFTISAQTRVVGPDGPDPDALDDPVPWSEIVTSLTVPTGQCCDGGTCLGDLNQVCCESMGGTFNGGLSCTTDPCACTGNEQCLEMPVDNICTTNTCVSMVCQTVNNTLPCDNGDFCTVNDVCAAGMCMAGPARTCPPATPFCNEDLNMCVECLSPANCSDDNPCTNDVCSPEGVCSNPNNTAPCADDGNVCTDDVCGGGVCTHPFNTASCTDGLFCTRTERCQNGVCTVTAIRECPLGTICCEDLDACLECCVPADPICDDDNDCTADMCSVTPGPPPMAMCVNSPVTGSCEDGLFCTAGDMCVDGECVAGTASPCEPGETCVEDQDMCIACEMPEDCDDMNECTQDFCEEGMCVYMNESAGTACGNAESGPCDNRDTCDGSGVCQPNNVPNGTPCDDGMFCNGDDLCLGGLCGVHEGNPCMSGENCNEDTNMCVPAGECDGPEDCPDDTANPCTIPACLDGVCGFSFAPMGTACGSSSTTECDAPDTCDGAGMCVNRLDPAGTVCRPAASACDVAEMCSGTSATCPPNAFQPMGTACGSSSTTDCDAPDTCDGAGTCVNRVDPAGSVCRPAVGECDVAESCNGTSAACPANGFVPSGTACGSPSSTDCDAPDTCDGAGMCVNRVDPAGTVCRPAVGECDMAETCNGSSAACPANAFRPLGTACGSPNATDCDAPDTCDGAGMCINRLDPAGTICRPSAGECDAAETCSGTSATCPPNVQSPNGTPCGDPSNTECTDPDTCLNGVCQRNDATNGTPCMNDTNQCTSDVCNGGVCVHPPVPVGTPCGDPSTDACDNPDTCDAAGMCRSNLKPDGTPCPNGLFCDGPETCRGGECTDGANPCRSLAHCDELNDVCFPCITEGECNDADPCTTDACVSNVCVNTPIPGCIPAFGDRPSINKKGSLLIYSKVELKWRLDEPDLDGGVAGHQDPEFELVQDTFLSLNNDFPGDVNVQLYFINGDPPTEEICAPLCPPINGRCPPQCVVERAHPGWNWVDCQFLLTPNQPTYWSVFSGQPVGCQPFWVLDPGFPPGRPDPDSVDEGSRVLRGYVIGWAVDRDGREIRWNHLFGNALVVNYDQSSAWEYNAWALQAVSAAHGEQTDGEPGQLLLDGIEYDNAFERLVFEFYATGAAVFGRFVPGPVFVDTDITLHPVSADLRQETNGPVITKARFDIWNEDETRFSGTERCINCWDQTLMSNYGAPNHFTRAVLGTDKGKARVDGIASQNCPLSVDAALLGITVKRIIYLSKGMSRRVAESAINMVGQGEQTAIIRYDIIPEPDEVVGPLIDKPEGDSIDRVIPLPRR